MDLNRGVVVAHGAETVLTVSTPRVAPLLLFFHGFDVGAVAKSVRNEIDGDVGADGGRALGTFVVHDFGDTRCVFSLFLSCVTLWMKGQPV